MADGTAEEKKPSLISNVLAIAGLIVVLIIIIWGLIHFATLLSPWFSSLFGQKQTTASALQVQAPASATSGTPLTVSWTYSRPAQGVYAFLYPCNDGLRFETAGVHGVANTIPCGAAFSVASSPLIVTPVLSGTKAITEQLTVIFEPTLSQSGTAQAQGSATITVSPGTKPVQAVQPAGHTGPADLAVQIISANVDQGGWATVVFDVSNIGSGDSGGYSFVAYLPTRSSYVYYSPEQISLAPGSHIVSTLRFTQAMPGTISIIVDPSNAVNDTNRTNNYAAQNLSIPSLPAQAGGYDPQTYSPYAPGYGGTQYDYNNPYNYYGQPYVY